MKRPFVRKIESAGFCRIFLMANDKIINVVGKIITDTLTSQRGTLVAFSFSFTRISPHFLLPGDSSASKP